MISLFCGDSNPLDCQARGVLVDSDFCGSIFMDLAELLRDYWRPLTTGLYFILIMWPIKCQKKVCARIYFFTKWRLKIKLVGCG